MVGYAVDAAHTLVVAVAAYIAGVVLALAMTIMALRKKSLMEPLEAVTTTAQSYPIVAVIPVLFVVVGDGIATQLLVAIAISYFPILLALLGVAKNPVPEVEHFYTSVGTPTAWQTLRIRASENFSTIQTALLGSASLAMVGAILAEMISVQAGIGFSVVRAMDEPSTEGLLVALFVIGIVTCLFLTAAECFGRVLGTIVRGESRSTEREPT